MFLPTKCQVASLSPEDPLRLNARLNSTKPQARVEYNWIKGVETLEEYQPGDYHPVMIDDVLYRRYRIVDKLSHGGYSTVWLARDTALKRYVALKFNTADAHPPHGRSLIPVVFDKFKIQGPNGTHACYTTAPVQCNLREISFSRLFPLDVARALCYGLTQAVAYTHSHRNVHGGSYPPENIIIKFPSNFDNLSTKELYERYGEPETVLIKRCDGKPLTPNIPAQAVKPLSLGKYVETMTLADVRPLLSDFGEAFAPASEVRLGQDCHKPPAFRSPEARFDPQKPLAYSLDIWSLATAIWEVMGMKPLFRIEMVPDDEIVAQHIDGRGKFFTKDGHSKDAYVENKWPPLEERMWRGALEDEEMLLFQPEARPTAEDVLQSEWMAKWALPAYERSLNISG
ncbi:kinase-like protein [Aspergillus eucalypticola CBS 122712]|uniref:non-specific serine/threonine protein kinase n=1 Tax=Aspergillus eucalypticola (strain CBS 122712 / IBT 29274) TaxID=1448314 RepID=A0A317W7U4_ASPEC|nr:kinase-like protein [Aspergillus eucalypticola CBS 122712]PWY82716.1 kinase-like protein [Aspergillus eucalypticola CBS 122712]